LTSELGYPHANVKTFGTGNCLVLEIIGTFMLMWVILMIGKNTSTRPNADVYGIAIGGTVGLCILAFGSVSGTCLNPHRFFGPALIAGELWKSSYDYWWIYIVGPYTGGALAGLVYYWGFIDWNGKEEKEQTEEPKLRPKFSFVKEDTPAKAYQMAVKDTENKVLVTLQDDIKEIKGNINAKKVSGDSFGKADYYKVD